MVSEDVDSDNTDAVMWSLAYRSNPTEDVHAKSTVLSVEDEAIVIAFRRHTLLPLDDCLYAL